MHWAVKLSLTGLVFLHYFETVDSSVETGTIVEKSYALVKSALMFAVFLRTGYIGYFIF